jgi:4-hydroxy-tetrahydrodipicolinate synthase
MNPLDFDALGKMIDFVIDNSVEYIVSLGTTGETPTLEKEEKLDMQILLTTKLEAGCL